MAKKKRRPEDTKTAAPDTAPPAPAPPVPGLAVAVPLLFAGLAIAFAASNAPAGLAFWNRGRPVSDLGSEAARPDPGRNLGTTTAPASTAPCSEAAEWLSPARGYHVLCVRDGAVSSGADAAAATRLPWGDAPGWRRAVEAAAGIDARVLPVGGVAGFFQRCLDRHPECRKWALSGECDKNPSYMRSDCAGACDTCPDTDTPSSPRWARQPWRAFATDGAVVTAETGSAYEGLLLLFEGGQWIWPGVSVGYNRTVVAGDKTVVLETLSMKPLVLSVGGFLGNDECDTIIGLSEPHMASSQVSLMDKDKGKAATEFRTSSTYFLPSVHPTLRTIDARVEALAHVDRTHQEFVQVLRYGKGQKYGAHHDYWDPKFYQDEKMMRMIQGGHNNRLATVFWYMSNVNGGGETSFPFSASPLGKRPHRGNPGDDRCGEFGLAVKPEKGKVIVFYSLQPDGSGDETSLHAACKPTDETEVKWSGNKWLWNTPQRHIQ